MSFWIRHAALLVLCVLAPFIVALNMDTGSTLERAKESSRRSLQLAVRSLPLILRDEAAQSVSTALSTAQQTIDNDRFDDLRRSGAKGDVATQEVLRLLNDATPRKGFAWLVDGDGRVILSNGQTAIDESPRSIQGHPIFVQTQLGFALDGIWSSHNELVLVSGAPLVDDGKVKGAVLVGRPVDRETIREWAETLRGHITLAVDRQVLVSSAPDALANEVVEAAYDEVRKVYAGDREQPLTDSTLPFLPMLIDHRMTGEAFVSFGTPVQGAPNPFRWVISVDATDGLAELAERQSAVLGAMVASFLVALLIGILNFRSFVQPTDRIEQHLSELQMGRGDLEMPEASVSHPFRRLVRLINMTVQKIPNRSLALPSADISSIARPNNVADDLSVSEIPVLRQSSLPALGARPTPAPPPEPRAASELLEAPEPIESQSLDGLPAPSSVPPSEPAQVVSMNSNGVVSATLEQLETIPPDTTVGFEGPPDLASLGVPATPGAEAAIADAIAQLEGASLDAGLQSPSPTPSGGVRRSAADIRGRPMGSSTPSEVPFEEISVPPPGNASHPPSNVRGGGSLDLGQSAALPEDPDERPPFGPEETVVAPVATELLARSARDDLTGRHAFSADGSKPDSTLVANVPSDAMAKSSSDKPRDPSVQLGNTLEPEDRAHFKDVYERFIDLRRRCGESTSDLAFDRFLSKLTRNRETLMKKYNCRTVRFQVYKKDGKAALKATPVGSTR